MSIHIRNNQTSDGKFSSAMYQDGLLHQLSSILISTALGTKKKVDFENDYGNKLNHLNKMRRRKDLIEIALVWSSGGLKKIQQPAKVTYPGILSSVPHASNAKTDQGEQLLNREFISALDGVGLVFPFTRSPDVQIP